LAGGFGLLLPAAQHWTQTQKLSGGGLVSLSFKDTA